MSVVTSAVIYVSYAPQAVEQQLTEPQLFGRAEGWPQRFQQMSGEGGGKVLQADVYAAGLNHIGTQELEDWFLGLPWDSASSAVLIYSTEGDFERIVTTPAWGKDLKY